MKKNCTFDLFLGIENKIYIIITNTMQKKFPELILRLFALDLFFWLAFFNNFWQSLVFFDCHAWYNVFYAKFGYNRDNLIF